MVAGRANPRFEDALAFVAWSCARAVARARPTCSRWFSPGKQARLEDLCGQLGLEASGVGRLRYQLLHRTVSSLIEARRYGAGEALTLVHSFDPDDSSLDAYQAFAGALGLSGAEPNAITSETIRGDVTLRLGWVREC